MSDKNKDIKTPSVEPTLEEFLNSKTDLKEIVKIYNERTKLIDDYRNQFSEILSKYDPELKSIDGIFNNKISEKIAEIDKDKQGFIKQQGAYDTVAKKKIELARKEIKAETARRIKEIEVKISKLKEKYPLIEKSHISELKEIAQNAVSTKERLDDSYPKAKRAIDQRVTEVRGLNDDFVQGFRKKIAALNAKTPERLASIRMQTESERNNLKKLIIDENKRFDEKARLHDESSAKQLEILEINIETLINDANNEIEKIRTEDNKTIKQTQEQLDLARSTQDYRFEKFISVELEYREGERDRKIAEVRTTLANDLLDKRDQVREFKKQQKIDANEIDKERINTIENVNNALRKLDLKEDLEIAISNLDHDAEILLNEQEIEEALMKIEYEVEDLQLDYEKHTAKIQQEMQDLEVVKSRETKFSDFDADVANHALDTEVNILKAQIKFEEQAGALRELFCGIEIISEKEINVRKAQSEISSIDAKKVIAENQLVRDREIRKEELLYLMIQQFTEVLKNRSEKEYELSRFLVDAMFRLTANRLQEQIDNSNKDWDLLLVKTKLLGADISNIEGKGNESLEQADYHYLDMMSFYNNNLKETMSRSRKDNQNAIDSHNKILFFADKVELAASGKFEKESHKIKQDCDKRCAAANRELNELDVIFEKFCQNEARNLKNEKNKVNADISQAETTLDIEVNNLRNTHTKFNSSVNQKRDITRIEHEKIFANNSKAFSDFVTSLDRKKEERNRHRDTKIADIEKMYLSKSASIVTEKQQLDRAYVNALKESDKQEHLTVTTLIAALHTDYNDLVEILKQERSKELSENSAKYTT